MKMNSQSLADIASYPYPTRSQEQQFGDNQPSVAVYDAPTVPSNSRLPEQGPAVVFVYPTRDERLRLEGIRLERQVHNWEDEGGSVQLIRIPLS